MNAGAWDAKQAALRAQLQAGHDCRRAWIAEGAECDAQTLAAARQMRDRYQWNTMEHQFWKRHGESLELAIVNAARDLRQMELDGVTLAGMLARE